MQHLCLANTQEGSASCVMSIHWLDTNTQEGAVSYAMCVHWLDMPSPPQTRPTIPMVVPSPKLAIQQPFYAEPSRYCNMTGTRDFTHRRQHEVSTYSEPVFV